MLTQKKKSKVVFKCETQFAKYRIRAFLTSPIKVCFAFESKSRRPNSRWQVVFVTYNGGSIRSRVQNYMITAMGIVERELKQ
jgi:hypothetical protein